MSPCQQHDLWDSPTHSLLLLLTQTSDMVIAELNTFIKLHEEVLSYFCILYNIMVVIGCCRYVT